MPTTSADTSATLKIHWTICFSLIFSLVAYNIACHFWLDENRLALEESQRVMIRSMLYLLAIVLFPITKLVRHILLRLNQTMPGHDSSSARYLKTLIITQSMIEVVALFGPIMFYLGDDYNTLYIFSLLGAVGLYLHRPQANEYQSIERFRATNDRWQD